MARLEIGWSEPQLNGYDHINPDDFYTALPADYRSADKPILVYVTSGLKEDENETKVLEKSVLGDESVEIGATLFRSIKLDGAKIKESNPYWRTIGGKALPRIVVVDTTGTKVGSVEGQEISSSRVFELMKKAAARTYKSDLAEVVKGTKDLLTQIDQIEAKRKANETRKAAGGKDKEKELAAETAKLDKQMKEIEAREVVLKKKWSEEKKLAKA